MIPLSRPKRKFPVYLFESTFLSRTPKVGVEVLTVLAVVMCAGAFAQQQIVLTNVTVIDGTGSPAQRNRTVVIKGDRIQSIAAGHEHTPSSAKVIDLQGQTIMPLIINTHGHLGLTKGNTQSAANQTDDNFRHQLLRYQEYGVGAALSMGTDGKRFAEIRDDSRRGALPGADVYTAGIGFGLKNGVPPATIESESIWLLNGWGHRMTVVEREKHVANRDAYDRRMTAKRNKEKAALIASMPVKDMEAEERARQGQSAEAERIKISAFALPAHTEPNRGNPLTVEQLKELQKPTMAGADGDISIEPSKRNWLPDLTMDICNTNGCTVANES